MEKIVAQQVLFSGFVQGVGFRRSTWRLAQNFKVAGYVRNLSDGRVELILEGDAVAILDFLEVLQRSLGRHIKSTESCGLPVAGYRDFTIR